MIRDNNIDENAQIAAHKIVGGNPLRSGKKVWYVDGNKGGDGNSGRSPLHAVASIQQAVNLAENWDTIRVFPLDMATGATDPSDYAETVIIPADKEGLAIVGVGTGRTQGGLPQIKIGTGSTAMFTVRAPAVRFENLCVNGASSTGGGILLDDNGTTKTAFGVTMVNCYFKNCKAHATNGKLGGAVYLGAGGGAWQLLIQDTKFFNNVGGVVCPDSVSTVPKDWVLDNCEFNSDVNTATDVDVYGGTGGVVGLVIRNTLFGTVDIPANSGGTVGRYISLASGSKGVLDNCTFACTVQGSGAKTFGTTGNAAVIPTTVRISNCHGECESTSASNVVLRTL